jgi:hypothetical protein
MDYPLRMFLILSNFGYKNVILEAKFYSKMALVALDRLHDPLVQICDSFS